MTDDNEQLEFDFNVPSICKCTEVTKYEDLCPVCLAECLEYVEAQQLEDLDLSDYEEHA